MANYVASALAKAQVKASQKFGESETRKKTPSVMGLAVKNADISIPKPEIERVHENRVVDINYFTSIAAGSDTAKAALHTGSIGDSAKVNLTYNTVVEKFSIPIKLANNNVYAYEELFANQWMQHWKNLVSRQDTLALANAISNRCQLTSAALATPVAASGAGDWNQTTYALEIPYADKNLSVQKAEAFMAARYFTGSYDVISDLQTKSLFEYLVNQGSANSTNTSFQFGSSMITPTQSIVSASYSNGAFLIMPEGALAGINWTDKMNKQGINEGQTETGIFTTAEDPFGYGVKADISIYTKRANTSADTTGGSTQDLLTQVEMSLTIAYAAPPLSTANDGAITLVGIASES